ncbi:MAG: winged helix-turn-helix transcriptional regulator [Acidimicrobiia bacterium]|nr:winged helix-turn-helix transcriptional regulator [Acidimicrobiia bacterium]NND13338.1 winged helix-turn-helix transcriptional regulator [Acidimicrobiia bacterium]
MQNILPILRTETQQELLIELFFVSQGPRTLSDLARAIDVDQTTVMREVNRLLETGLIIEERVGRSRTVAIDPNSPLASPMRQLMRLVYDPAAAYATTGDSRFAPKGVDRRPHHRPLPSSRRRST